MPAAGRCTLQWTTSGTRRCLSMREATASTHRTRSACAAFVDAGGAGCLCAHRRAQSCKVQGNSVSGEGSALGSAAVLQDRSFWCAPVARLCRAGLFAAAPRWGLTPRAVSALTFVFAGRPRW
jgi:hypothetical protein